MNITSIVKHWVAKKDNKSRTTFVYSAFSLLIATLVLVGWIFDIPTLVQVKPNWVPMVVNTAICCWLSGFALVFSSLVKHKNVVEIQKYVGLLVLAITAIVMLESILSLNINIDLPDLHRPLQPEYINPGRMAPNTALALMLFAIGLLINCFNFNLRNIALRSKIVGLIAFVVLILGCLGVIGYWLKLEYLYNWTNVVRMSLPTTVCIIFLGLALFNLPAITHQQAPETEKDSIRNIYFSTTFVICLIGISSGAAGFSLLALRTEILIADQLKQVIEERIFSFNISLEANIKKVVIAAEDSRLKELLSALNKHRNQVDAQQGLIKLAEDFKKNGFETIVFEDISGQKWQGLGELSQSKYFTVPIISNFSNFLVWKNGYWMLSRIAVRDYRSKLLGYVIVESQLKSLNELTRRSLRKGTSNEMLICSPANENLYCFPTNLEKNPFLIKQFYHKQRLPISFATNLHQIGVITTLDYRGERVLAAYSPIGKIGLGMVIKINIAEIYAPIKEQFKKTAFVILALIIFGLFLVRKHLFPLVRKINIAKQEAEQDRARFVAAAEGGFDCFYIFDAVRNSNNEIVDFRCNFINQKGSELISKKPNEFLGKLLCEELPQTRGALYFDTYKHVVETGHSVYDEINLKDPQIQAYWIARQIIKLGDGIAITARDITGQKNIENSMRHLATHDVLTKLPNRILFDDRVNVALERAKRDRQQIAIALIDLDYFKHINDTYGHTVGDAFLQQFAQRLTENIRPSDTAARLGGDEFGLVLPNIVHPNGSAILLTKLFKVFKEPIYISGHKLKVSFSIGICAYPENGKDLKTLLHHADIAMYNAKGAGRNNFQIYINSKSD